MDNITHTLVGAVLAQTGLKRKTRKGAAALILGANAPDIDVFLGWVPWAPLATHRGFTHGLLAVLIIMPALTAGMLWLIDRWQARHGRDFAAPLHMGWLFALCLIGCLTHPLLDWQTTYAVQWYSPFSTRWYHVDTLFIIDLWLWIALGATCYLSWRREKRGQEWQRLPRVTLAATLAYVSMNAVITGRAEATMIEQQGEVDRIAASPPPLAFWKRDLVSLSSGSYRWAHYDPLGRGLRFVRGPEPSGMGDPAVMQAASASPVLDRFMHWSIMPIATVSRNGCETTVTVSDARYQQALTRGNFQHVLRLARSC